MSTHLIDGHPFALVSCPACGIQFLLPEELVNAALRLRDQYEKGDRALYCPDGHSWHYVRPTGDQRSASARAEIERLAERVVDLEDRLAASDALVKKLGGNVTAFPAKGVAT